MSDLPEVTELRALADRIGRSTDRFVGVGNRLITAIDAASNAQSRQQRTTIALTLVIAIATIAYTVTTYMSVQAMKEANRLQAEGVAVPRQVTINASDDPSNRAMQPDAASPGR